MTNVINPDIPDTQQTPPPARTETPAEDVATIKAELASIKGQLTEQQRNAEYWFNQASRGAAAPAAPQQEEEEAEDDVDVLDVLTTQGAKGLDQILARRGYVRASEVDARVNSKASQMVQEQRLLTDYPDLGDNASEFFQATAKHYGSLKAQGVPENVAMRLAAQQAELEGFKSGKRKTGTNDREAQRLARIAAQSGEPTNRVQEGSAADDELTDHERYICQAMGISEDAYKARAQKGVQMSGIRSAGGGVRASDGRFAKKG